ncbi:amino acid permease [Sandarakinorhabdus sp.]|jgi:basic amino acid/polyamine antiporter, APA family|uniref:amino acid permease n=1 Tax=Sandarakinorhabdus sp. TaxID=1916663 RepID=UPI0033425506
METPQRSLGLMACIALVMGNMVGSGVFLLPATLAPYGWSAMGGWVIALAGTLALAGCYAALSRQLPGLCGPHAYVERAFGGQASYYAAWSYWIGVWVGNAALAVAVVSNLTVLWPALATVPGLGVATSVAVLVLVTLINLNRASVVSWFQQATLLAKLVPLLAVVGIAGWLLLTNGAAAVVTPPAPMEAGGVITSVTLTMWAFLAFESATVPGDKVIRPEFTVPAATIIGTLLAGLLYMAISAAMIALMPEAALAKSNAPFADFAAPFVGRETAALIGVFAAISALGTVNGLTLMAAELPRAMALAGQFPPRFAGLNRHGAAAASVWLASGLAAVLVLFNVSRSLAGLFEFFILVATSAMLIGYLAVALAAVKLLGGALRLVAVAGCGYAVFALYAAGLEPNLWSLGLVAAAWPMLAYTSAQAKRRSDKMARAAL